MGRATFAGLIAAGAPPMLFVTQAANGTLVVESPMNEGQSRLYVPGQKTTTPVGQGGDITMAAEWQGRTHIAQGTLLSSSGVSTTVKEIFQLSPDGKTLTIEISDTAVPEAPSRLNYTRITSVGPCEKWPTPCKRPPLK